MLTCLYIILTGLEYYLMRLDDELWMRKAGEKEDELGTILWCSPDSRRFNVDTEMRIYVTDGELTRAPAPKR